MYRSRSASPAVSRSSTSSSLSSVLSGSSAKKAEITRSRTLSSTSPAPESKASKIIKKIVVPSKSIEKKNSFPSPKSSPTPAGGPAHKNPSLSTTNSAILVTTSPLRDTRLNQSQDDFSTTSEINPSPKYLLGWHNAHQGHFHPLKRQGHSCAAYNALMLVFGGYSSGQIIGDMWFLDTVKLRWTRFEPVNGANPGPGKRTGHTAVVVKDKMYLFGGETGSACSNEFWIFDIASKTWKKFEPTEGSKVPSPRCGHSCIVYGSNILLFGGADRMSTIYGDLWLFDTISNKWSLIETENAPTKRHGHTLTLVDDQAILFGGFGPGGRVNDTWRLDPVSLTWSALDVSGNRPMRRSHHSAIALNNKVLLYGGLGSSAFQDLWEFNLITRKWNRVELSKNPSKLDDWIASGNLLGPAPRFGHSACLFRGLRMIIFGGVGDANSYRDDLWYLYIDPTLEGDMSLEAINISGAGVSNASLAGGSSSIPMNSMNDEDLKNWKKAHDRTMEILDGVRVDVEEEKKVQEGHRNKLIERFDQHQTTFDSHGRKISRLEKKVKVLRHQDRTGNEKRFTNLEESLKDMKAEMDVRSEEHIQSQKDEISELLDKISALEVEVSRSADRTRDFQTKFETLKVLEEQFGEFRVESTKISEDLEKSKARAKKLKYTTEISVKNLRKDLEKSDSVLRDEIAEMRRTLADSSAAMSKGLVDSRLSFLQEISELEKDLDEQRDSFAEFRKEDAIHKQNIATSQQKIALDFQLKLEENATKFDEEANRNAAKMKKINAKLLARIDAQEAKLQEEREIRMSLEGNLANLNQSFDERIKEAERNLMGLITEKTKFPDYEPRFSAFERQLSGLSDELEKVENVLREEMEQKEVRLERNLKEKIENRLQKIKAEVEKLLRAVKGQEISEGEDIDEFTQRVVATLQTTNNLQQALMLINELN